ncbi:16S rRNA (adenine(1518)-N(6)/adenine(1519)-N(6))-dimethyltransferase RsmA [Woodsholea maritima]|uniref:16S rRNA (adenine(1518)-N(6)/adenine(1519)-N(6))- dimethyltransferase RsmA n=1 Tax=Woodsholea maritima TaxID=240237 RepID=UPI000370149C|nr:16S rRNA (adenine(1518)-N(6)/adenine(1519)-N(6))-dimethyltransferase RsmA [Woodsholea maritima]
MSEDRLPPLRDVIAHHGLGAKKSFGQHFLLDLNLTGKIARQAGDLRALTVFEIGPGPGGLTRALLAQDAKQVIAIEKDPRFLDALNEVSEAFDHRLKILEGDALEVDERAQASDDGPFAIVANLPYNVGTPLLIKWLTADPLWWQSLVLMFQKEVAERIVARPGDKAYGRLAVISAARTKARYAFTVPARAFTPPPKVDSAIAVLEPLPEDQQFKDLDALGIVTESAFGQRRKTLRKSLAQAATQIRITPDEWLAKAEIEPSRRAETLTIEEFFTLARLWRAAR